MVAEERTAQWIHAFFFLSKSWIDAFKGSEFQVPEPYVFFNTSFCMYSFGDTRVATLQEHNTALLNSRL
jgi:hypothetical protein